MITTIRQCEDTAGRGVVMLITGMQEKEGGEEEATGHHRRVRTTEREGADAPSDGMGILE